MVPSKACDRGECALFYLLVVVYGSAAGRVSGRHRGVARPGPLCLRCSRVGERWKMKRRKDSYVNDVMRSDWYGLGTIHEYCRRAYGPLRRIWI